MNEVDIIYVAAGAVRQHCKKRCVAWRDSLRDLLREFSEIVGRHFRSGNSTDVVQRIIAEYREWLAIGRSNRNDRKSGIGTSHRVDQIIRTCGWIHPRLIRRFTEGLGRKAALTHEPAAIE